MSSITTLRIILTTTLFLAIAWPTCAACPTQKRNLADQPQRKTPRFAIAGTIDIDNDGLSDLPLIRKLITDSGGVIDMQLDIDGNSTGRLRSDTTYLVLGNIPPMAEMSPRVAQQFEALMRQAKERNLRVIHVDLLLPFSSGIRAETGEVSRRFRERQPPSRGRRGSAY